MLDDSSKCWTAQCPDGSPAEGVDNTTSSCADIKLAAESTINTALIEEIGNQVQYFRIQAFVDGEWKTVYQSEKIQDMRLCGFDAVTTDRIRLSIDKFRDDAVPANIKSLKLYNEPKRNAEGFEVSAYQRLDGDVPTEILAKGDEYVRNYAKFYDVYSTVIVFAAVHWDENGNMNFGEMGEEKFAQELTALKAIIAKRQNQSHRVKLIVTASWRTLESANYWDSKYYNVPDAGQIYDGTFCSPALAGDKTAYALLSGAGGVMVFRVGCDRLMDDQNSVTGGIEDTLNRYVTGW